MKFQTFFSALLISYTALVIFGSLWGVYRINKLYEAESACRGLGTEYSFSFHENECKKKHKKSNVYLKHGSIKE